MHPVSPNERVQAIDKLRGLALGGVLLVNLLSAFRIPLSSHILGLDQPLGPGGAALLSLVGALLEFKAFTLFSILFGVGVAIQSGRAGQKGIPFFLRRFATLFFVGLVHLLLVWNGDILMLYAGCGLLMLPLLRLPPPALTGLGLLLIASPYFIPFPVRLPPETTLRELTAGALETYRHAKWSELAAFRWHETKLLVLPLLVLSLPRTLGLMLCGAAAWNQAWFERRSRVWLWILVLGLTLGLMGILTGDDRIGTIPLALAYFAAILLWNPPMPWVAAAGRMALTNYLLQFVVFGFIFYGYGLGQFGSWGVGLTCAAGLVFYCAQLAASHWWLQRFHFGPFEWLWRSVSYRQWQPLYRTEEARMFSSRALYLLLPATFLILPIVHLGLPWLLAQLGPHWGWRNGHPGPLNWLGVLPILGGAALLAWILAAMLGNVKRLPPRIRFGLRPAAFLESGPYALCRHPMYVAEGCLWVGVSVLAGSPIVVAALACGLIFASAWLIPHEEAALIHQFGDSYRAYRARVPALPKPR